MLIREAMPDDAPAIVLYEQLGHEREGVCRAAAVRNGEPIAVAIVARLP